MIELIDYSLMSSEYYVSYSQDENKFKTTQNTERKEGWISQMRKGILTATGQFCLFSLLFS
jgi:hypothetical protein